MSERDEETIHPRKTSASSLAAVLFAAVVLTLFAGCGKSGHEPPAAINPIPPIRNAFKLSMDAVAGQIRNYAIENGQVPQGDDVSALLKAGIRDAPQVDPWNTPVRYRGEGNAFVLSSAGPDKKWGTSDDIVVKGG